MYPRYALAFILFFACPAKLFSQCNDWDNLISGYRIFIQDTERDRFGNIYMVGYFGAQFVDIGDVHLELEGNEAIGDVSCFLIKFDKNFNAVWGKSSGLYAFGQNVEIDSKGDVVMSGHFYGKASFDCIELSTDGRSDTFVTKISPNGMVYWAVNSNSGNDDYESDLAITPEDNIVVGGVFLGTPVFGVNVPKFGGYDAFVAQFDTNGNVQWVKSMGGPADPSYDYLYGVAVDTQGNVVITGYHGTEELHIDNFVLEGSSISQNFFLAKIDATGNTLWAKNTPGALDAGYAVDTDFNDNIFVIGRFEEGSYSHGAISLTSNGEADVFVAKYSPDGDVINAINFGGERFESPDRIKVDNDGNIIATGYFYSYEFDIGSLHVTKPEFQNDLFIIKFDPQLNFICMNRTSGDGENVAASLEVDDANNVMLVVHEILGYTTHFDNKYVLDGDDHPAMFVMLGDAENFDPDPNLPFTFSVNLGDDITTCQAPIELSAGDFCNATYQWSSGEHTAKITTTQAGTYWVDVTINGTTVRDSIDIVVQFEDIDLGPDMRVCPGSDILLDATVSCNANYVWSTGSALKTLTVTQPGTYWVEANSGGHIERDTITITWKDLAIVDLGDDVTFCEGDVVSLDAQQNHAAQYLWSTGEIQPTKLVTDPGVYWVRVTGECNSDTDTISVSTPEKIIFTLGDDKKICVGEELILSPGIDGDFEYSWAHGSDQRELSVTQSGQYQLTVSSLCESVSDMIVIDVVTPEALNIPNVVTANPEHDEENNTFILPDDLRGSRVSIFNRWGNLIFTSTSYQNTWPEVNVPAGVYFYQLHGICGNEPMKGSIHLMH